MPDPAPESETHIAGLDVVWDGRYLRQRCAWCGAVLIDVDLANIAVREGDDPTYPTWPVGELVGRSGAAPYLVEPEPSETGSGAKVPDDACVRLDPTITC